MTVAHRRTVAGSVPSRARAENARVPRDPRALPLDDLTKAEEGERLRIASEIHDDTAQVLDAVGLQLDEAVRDMGDRAAKQILGHASEEVHSAATRLRTLMFELMAPVEHETLHEAVESYCAVLLAGTEIGYHLEGEPQGLLPGRRLLAYRLIQEAMRNIVKHAHAHRVLVTMLSTEHELIVSVSDDGVGLRAARGEQPAIHAGLQMIRQRSAAAGGAATTGVGLEGRGTSVEVRLPLREGPR